MSSNAIWEQRRSQESSTTHQARPGDLRSPGQRDRARVLHSAAFRRLQSKTQIMDIGQNDFYRTRLTHSLEVAQIGASFTNQLLHQGLQIDNMTLPDFFMMEAMCLAHDIGHPPFGHGGEVALHYKMRQSGGFEGNGQTFRIVTKLENYHNQYGMDLTRRTQLGLLKYPVLMPDCSQQIPNVERSQRLNHMRSAQPPKALFHSDAAALDWVLAPLSTQDREFFQATSDTGTIKQRSLHKSFDASMMELADDIAYGVHDLEDAIVLGTLPVHKWTEYLEAQQDSLPAHYVKRLHEWQPKLFGNEHYERKYVIGALVNIFITAVQVIETIPDAQEPLIRYNVALPDDEKSLLHFLKSLVFKYVIEKTEIQQVRFRSQNMLLQLFDAFYSDPMRLLPDNSKSRWKQALEQEGQAEADRVICDYISGMTDEYARHMYERLFGS